MSAPFVTQSSAEPADSRSVPRGAGSFPKSRRLLRPAEFRTVYNQGFKVTTGCFVAFCWRDGEHRGDQAGPRVGFTTPRALGPAADRNRMRRRLREVVRTRLGAVAPEWRIVWNLRRGALQANHDRLVAEVEKVLARCGA